MMLILKLFDIFWWPQYLFNDTMYIYVNLCIMSDYVGHCVHMFRFWQATQWVWSPGIQVSWPWAEIPLEPWLSVSHVARYWKPGHCSKDCQPILFTGYFFWNPSAINVNVSILHRISKAWKIGSKLKARRCVLVLRMVTPLQADQAVRPASVSIDGAAKTIGGRTLVRAVRSCFGWQYHAISKIPNGSHWVYDLLCGFELSSPLPEVSVLFGLKSKGYSWSE